METDIKRYTKKKTVWSWIILILALIYGVSPVDIVPDFPFVGWMDDCFIILFAVFNLIQFLSENKNAGLSKFAKLLKWVIAILGCVAILLLLLVGTTIVKLLG